MFSILYIRDAPVLSISRHDDDKSVSIRLWTDDDFKQKVFWAKTVAIVPCFPLILCTLLALTDLVAEEKPFPSFNLTMSIMPWTGYQDIVLPSDLNVVTCF